MANKAQPMLAARPLFKSLARGRLALLKEFGW
jgi:hypothetical protein